MAGRSGCWHLTKESKPASALLAALRPEDRPVWATAFYAGLRRGELQALRCRDLDLKANLIRVERLGP